MGIAGIKTFVAEEHAEPAAPIVPTAIIVTDTEAEGDQTKEVEAEEDMKIDTKVEVKVDPLADLKEYAKVDIKLPTKIETKVEEQNDVNNEVNVEEGEEDTKPGESIDEGNDPQEETEAPLAKQGVIPRRPQKFKQRGSKSFKSKPPKKGVIGFGEDIPGMDGLGADITVICPWEAFSHLELHELAQFGII